MPASEILCPGTARSRCCCPVFRSSWRSALHLLCEPYVTHRAVPWGRCGRDATVSDCTLRSGAARLRLLCRPYVPRRAVPSWDRCGRALLYRTLAAPGSRSSSLRDTTLSELHAEEQTLRPAPRSTPAGALSCNALSRRQAPAHALPGRCTVAPRVARAPAILCTAGTEHDVRAAALLVRFSLIAS